MEQRHPLGRSPRKQSAIWGELIAANLTRTRARERIFNFGPDYMQTQTVVIRRRGAKGLNSPPDLAGARVMVIGGSSYEELLESLQADIPGLEWEARDDVGIEDLLLAVADRAIDATLVDSSVYAINRSYYPRIEVEFTIGEAVPHAWAFPRGSDDSLVQKARTFLLQQKETGRLESVMNRFYAEEERLDRPRMFHFLQDTRERLPHFIDVFRNAGRAHEIDWRLLAAVGYQESNWNPAAESATGVRGIMMLTEQTAMQLGVNDRMDPQQSIDGGARYLARLHARLPARIPEPDRTWMALAAYNMGMGHLRDARRLTQKQGLDADKWSDVSQSLDLLSQEKWHSQTRYGYARGVEARNYVENVRRFYEVLVWMESREHPLLVTKAD